MHYQAFIPAEGTDARENLPRGSVLLIAGAARPSAGQAIALSASPAGPHERFADTCRHAAQRGERRTVQVQQLIALGIWDDSEGMLRFSPGRVRELQAWTGRPVHRGEIEASDSRQNQRMQARQDFRRAYMQGNMAKAAQISQRHGIHHW